jgi:hypothetical protein
MTAVAQSGVMKSGSNTRRSFNICCDAFDFERSRDEVLLECPAAAAAADEVVEELAVESSLGADKDVGGAE